MLSFDHYKKIYFIGIKGTAMSALAVICKQKRLKVAGSDVSEIFITDKVLRKERIKVFQRFDPKNLDWGPDIVVAGASWHDKNVEIQEVKRRKLKMISESKLRGILSRMKETIVVTGVHGKSTTTSLLAHLFKQAGLRPSWLVGTGSVYSLGGNGHWDKGKHFIVEGDEYVRSFNDLRPKFLDIYAHSCIITNLEWEHVDVYKRVEDLEKFFLQLLENTKRRAVVCNDWPSLRKIMRKASRDVITYGAQRAAQWRVYEFHQKEAGIIFRAHMGKKDFGAFSLPLFGKHNALNALSCIIMGIEYGIKLKRIKSALASFQGLERRFDISERGGIVFVDDYAHHPTEIQVTLRAIRKKYPDKTIWCAFQPHMASRTEKLLHNFSDVFDGIDHVEILDIFESAREKRHTITSRDLVKAINKKHVRYGGNVDDAARYLQEVIKVGDAVVTMGAGDVYKIRDTIAKNIPHSPHS